MLSNFGTSVAVYTAKAAGCESCSGAEGRHEAGMEREYVRAAVREQFAAQSEVSTGTGNDEPADDGASDCTGNHGVRRRSCRHAEV